MDQEISENIGDDDFIGDYVQKHKKELDELRSKATGLKFEGQWFIIGDDGYLKKRYQYATTSFEESEVSPRIILYPAGEADIQKAMGLCRELGMAMAVRTGGASVLWIFVYRSGKYADRLERDFSPVRV